jgi:Polyketide cyclase / dehydrase and lipid transport
MWQRTHRKTFHDITPAAVWHAWSDINNWATWNPGIEYCTLTEPFIRGSRFTLKPLGAPAVQVELIEVEPQRTFTDCTFFFGAKMYGKHTIEENEKGITLTTTVTITGPLGFVWRTLVGNKVVAKLPEQTEALIERARIHGL